MEWYALLLPLVALVALASGLTPQETQAHMQYYGNHRRPCGEAQFSVLVSDAQNYTLRSTGIPSHAAFRTSPYRAAIQELAYNFPREPVALERPLCVPHGVPIGFALDGVPFYNPLSKDWNNAIEGSCAQTYDRCGGNVDKNNQYYYSELPNFDQQCLDLNRAQEAVHIGVAIDGFPIYYERRFNASLLDECGGRYLDTTNKRFYRYVVSNQFPYTIGCFRGRVHNISTLTPCQGNEGEYGSLCACVNVGPPGMALGYKWLSKDAVTVGQCTRRPAIQERERAIICNPDQIPEPDFLEEDRRSKTCVDFRALYSLIVIQGHRGGLAPWTKLRNYGKEEVLEEIEEDNEYIRHFKALRWLLSDLDVLQYPELEKYEKILKNRTKPLCPEQQRKLRNALAQIWVVSFLREAYRLRPEASDYEKEEVQRAYYRLMYVLKTLKALEITSYVKKPGKKGPMDPWGIWIEEEEEDDDEEEMKKDEDKLEALIYQLTALQTLGQTEEREKKDGKKSEGGDENKAMRAKLISLLWEIQGMSADGKPKEMGGMGEEEEGNCEQEREGCGGNGYGGKGEGGNGCGGKEEGGNGCGGKEEGGNGCGGKAEGGNGCGGKAEGGNGCGGKEEGGNGCGGKAEGGKGCGGKAEGGNGCGGKAEGGNGCGGKAEGGNGCGGKAEGGNGCGGKEEGGNGCGGKAEGGNGCGGKAEGGNGCGGKAEGGNGCGGKEEGGNGCGGKAEGGNGYDCEGEGGKGGEGGECPVSRGSMGNGDRYGPTCGGPPRAGQCPPPPREGPPPPRGGEAPPPPRCGKAPPPPRGGDGGVGQCPSSGGRDQEPRDMMQDMMDKVREGGQGNQFQKNLEQIMQLISYLRLSGGDGAPRGMEARDERRGGY